MAWTEHQARRTATSKTWGDSAAPRKRYFESRLKTHLHYPSAGPDSEVLDSEVDFELRPVDNAQLDGWLVTAAGWHYALGQPASKATDGWVGLGGRQGAHWLQFRLLRVGYLHWPTRAWEDVGGGPTYNRAKLTRDVGQLTAGPPGAETSISVSGSATWAAIWRTPAGGLIDISWHVEGRHLKEDIVVNRGAREWMAANRPPATPIAETWFGFVFQLDVSDIPRWVINGSLQEPDGDFSDDDGKITLEDAQERLLAFLPISFAFSDADMGDEEVPTIALRKRLWLDGDGNHYLLVGARVDHLNSLPAGGVIFDPTLTLQPAEAASKDTMVRSLSAAKNYGTSSAIDVDRYDAGPDEKRGLIEFDCSSIPASATCDDATLSLWSFESKPTNDQNINEICVDNAAWPEGAQNAGTGGTGDSCWTYLDQDASPTSWAGSAGLGTSGATKATANVDYVSGTIGTITFPASSVDTEAQSALTASDVETWFGASNTNYGIVMRQQINLRNGAWHSSTVATAGYRPKLVVNYTLAGGADVNFSAILAAVSATSDALSLAVAREYAAILAAASNTPDTFSLSVSREFVAALLAASATPDTVALDIVVAFAAVLAAVSATPDNISLAVARDMVAVLAAASVTPDTIALDVLREMVAVLTAATITPNTISLDAGINFSGVLAAISATPDSITLPISREMQAVIAALSATPDTLLLAVSRELAAVLQAASATPDNISLAVVRELAAILAAASATPDTVGLDIVIVFAAVLAAISTTPDTIGLPVARELGAVLSAVSITPDTVPIAVVREMAAILLAASLTPDDVVLTVEGIVEFAAVLLAASTTPDTPHLAVLREMAAVLGATSTTPDVALAVSRQLAAVLAAASSTPDTLSLNLSLPLSAVLAATSITSDTVPLPVVRALSAALAASSVTPDIVSLPVLRNLAAILAAASLAPDDVILQAAADVLFSAVMAATSATPGDVELMLLRLIIGYAFVNIAPEGDGYVSLTPEEDAWANIEPTGDAYITGE